MDDFYKKLTDKEAKLALIGLGYVGLPLALEFAKYMSVVGFDVNEDRISALRCGIDTTNEISDEEFDNRDILFTSSTDDLKECSLYIVAVPTPIDEYNNPDLSPLRSATETIASVLSKGDYVVYESTVYPGCTEEECIPLLEGLSGLKFGEEFKVGYSPERINPGEKIHTLPDTIKVVSGSDEEALEQLSKIYGTIVKAGIHKAPSIKVAEAAKIIENTQRDVNIALMNELSIILGRMDINTYDVLDAAATKWNFLKFYPGLVGGHCIGVDPYYLVHKASKLKYHTQIISRGRYVNDTMGGYIAKKLIKKLIAKEINLMEAKVLIMGITFKENVSDIRNSKVVDIIRELNDYGVETDVMDPYADKHEVKREYGLDMIECADGKYSSIMVAVAHDSYMELDEQYFVSISDEGGILADIKGIYRGKVTKLDYWSL